MSEGWQSHLDIMLQDKLIKSAGLYGQDGVTWAASSDLTLPATEVRELIAGIRDPARFQEHGVTIAGTKYLFRGAYSDASAPTQTGFRAGKGPTFAVGVMTGKALIVVLPADGVPNPWNIQSLHLFAKQLMDLGF